MVLLRIVLCPTIVWGAWRGWPGAWLAAIVVLALLDDIADGMVARRLGCDTPAIRLADSLADTIFYLGVVLALWLRVPHLLRTNAVLLVALFSLEALRYGFDLWKFGKPASYHSYLAKAWGLVLAAAVVATLAHGGPRWAIAAALTFGLVTNFEGLLMSLLLRRWQNDVKTLAAALRLRAASHLDHS
jgi:CDP-diacylglycerol--glycerol-3-phosphate 3-phosphatidyltransferase